MIIERAMPLGGSVTIDGKDVDDLALKSIYIGPESNGCISVGNYDRSAPNSNNRNMYYNFPCHFAVDSKNKHLYSCAESGSKINKGDGCGWVSLKSHPLNSYLIKTFAYDGKVYIYGSGSSTTNNFYIYDGTSWYAGLKMPNAPKSMAVHNNNLYAVMVSSSTYYLYRYDGTSWTQLATTPTVDGISYGELILYKDELIYLIGLNAYKYVDDAWTQIDSITTISIDNTNITGTSSYPVCIYVEDDKLYVLQSTNKTTDSKSVFSIDVYDGTSVTNSSYIFEVNTSSSYRDYHYDIVRGMFVFNGKVHFVRSSANGSAYIYMISEKQQNYYNSIYWTGEDSKFYT